MSRARRIMNRLVIGRLFLLLLVTAPPAACSNATDQDTQTVKQTASKGPVELTVMVNDDTTSVGSPLQVDIRATAEANVEVTMPFVHLDENGHFGTFNVLSNEERPDYPDGDRRIWSQSLVVDSFEAGEQTIPSVTVHFTDHRGSIEITGTVETNPLPVEIISALGDAPETAALRDIRGPVTVPMVSWGLWILLGGMVIAFVGGLLVLLVQRGRASAAPPLPPHELARRQLDALEQEHLLEQQCFQPFYYRLTDILRHYIEGRFGMLAPTRTTPEFLQDMRSSTMLKPEQQEQLRGFMRFSDLVKFALHEPPVDDGHQALGMARSFVDETVPQNNPLQEEAP